MKSIVCSTLYGRLGNILFELAAGLSYAKKYGKEFRCIIRDLNLTPLFNYPLLSDKFKNALISNTTILSPLNLWCEDQTRPFKPIPYSEGNILIDGYCQTEKHFDANLVREIFKVPEQNKETLSKRYQGIENGVAISIRRGDYLKYKHIFNVFNEKFYTDVYNERFIGITPFISSDDIEWCKQTLHIPNAIFIQEDAENALFALSLCKHFILSCSSFSWWAAWIGEKENSHIIVPEHWFNVNCDLNSDDVIPDRWTKVAIKPYYLE